MESQFTASATLLVNVVVRCLDEKRSVCSLELSDGEFLPRGHVEQPHLDGALRVEDRVIRHCPLLGKCQTSQLSGLLEGLLEFKGHVFSAGKGGGK